MGRLRAPPARVASPAPPLPGTSSWTPSSGALRPVNPATASSRQCRVHGPRLARRRSQARTPPRARTGPRPRAPASPLGSASSGR
eukprot:1813324-Lingulodinium_polyedra.AAC.1